MDNVQPGQTLGPYRILNQIGQGGMATVYKAYHAAMDRYVAIKVLPRQLGQSAEFTGRFQQEALTIARLEHAHILPVHDYGEAEGVMYLVMRYLDAGTLKDRLQAGVLSQPDMDRIFTELGDALDYAHSAGVVHRDLKPSNVLLDSRGSAFLTDFGIAKLLESNVQFTSTGGLIGTPAYMSPEQAQGLKIDQRSDIYSLGIILYEMVTGRVPFEAETPLAVILKHLNEPLPLPSTVKPDVSPAVERVLLKALAKSPEDRFARVAEFVTAWKQALAESQTLRAGAALPAAPVTIAAATAGQTEGAIPVQPQGVITRPAGRPLRGPAALVGAVVVGGLALALCGGFMVVQLLSRAQPSPMPGETQPVAEATEVVSTPEPGSTAAIPIAEEPTDAPPKTGLSSWAAANTIYTVAVFKDKILTGGPGSLTVWNADGTVNSQWTSGNGLPDPYVNVILVDEEEGTIWAGTGGGLVQAHEDQLTVYNHDDGLDSSTVTAIAWMSQGLLVGTTYAEDGGGLNLLTDAGWERISGFPSTATTDEHPEMLSTSVSAVLEDDAGAWWVGTSNGLGRFDGQAWTRFSTADGLPDNGITGLMYEGDILWAATQSGVAQFDGNGFVPIEQLQGVAVYGMLWASDDVVWFAGGGGLARYAPDAADWQFYDYTYFPSWGLYGAAEADDGPLYFGSDYGLVRYDGQSFNVWTVPNVPTQAGYSRIVRTPGGQYLFVQEYGANADIFDPASETWSKMLDLPCEYCTPLAYDSAGKIWASSDRGLWIVEGDEVDHWTTEFGLPADLVTSVAFAPDGQAWLGTAGGVAVFDGQSVTQIYNAENAGLFGDFVRNVFAASDGSMWVSTEVNLSRYTPDGQWEHFSAGNPFGYDVRVNDIAEDASGTLWLATAGEGVYRLAGGDWDQILPEHPGVRLPSNDVTSVTVAPDGSLWFGTYYAGVARFDGSAWQSFGVLDGLINPNVNDILVDDAGAIWFATSGGITRYAP